MLTEAEKVPCQLELFPEISGFQGTWLPLPYCFTDLDQLQHVAFCQWLARQRVGSGDFRASRKGRSSPVGAIKHRFFRDFLV